MQPLNLLFVVLVIPNRHIDIFSTKVHILFLEEELEFISVLVKIIVMPEKHEESVMI